MRIRSIVLGICVCALSGLVAEAGTLVVTTTEDEGTGSLRDALAAASSGDTIQFAAALNGQTITLTSDELLIDKNLTVLGPGASLLAVRRSDEKGTPSFRIFEITPGNTVTIRGLTISNGEAFPDSGGGIRNNGSNLAIADSAITANSGERGGGIALEDAAGTMSASLIVSNSTVGGNSTAGFNGEGGGIYSISYHLGSTAVTIDGCTVSLNISKNGGFGGGISQISFDGGRASLSISNSTISGNTANSSGGAIANYSSGGKTTVTIKNSTFSNNTIFGSGNVIHDVRGVIVIANSILNGAGGNIFTEDGGVTSLGYNLSNDSGGGFLTGPGDHINTNPLLGPLQNNGGPTFTHELLMGSPAINTGDPSFTPPPTFDQRGTGFPRVFSLRLDIGSFERQTIAPTPTATATATATPTASPTLTPGLTPTPTPSPAAITKLLNISTRLRVLTGDNVLIGGFIVTGSIPKRVIVRAIGPSLTSFGVPGALADPALELHGPGAFITINNENWRDTQETEIQATGIAPTDNLESAIVATLPPGAYTAIVRGSNGGTGVGLVEAYDLDSAANAQLANISTRGFVGTGGNVMIGGFLLGGSTSASAIIRAIGPSLAAFGVLTPLADPTLELHNSNGDIIAANDGWKDNQQAEIEATGISPSNDLESAIVQIFAPGAYTAIVRGKDNTTGVALVEAYQLSGASTPTPSPTPTANPTATPTSTPPATPKTADEGGTGN